MDSHSHRIQALNLAILQEFHKNNPNPLHNVRRNRKLGKDQVPLQRIHTTNGDHFSGFRSRFQQSLHFESSLRVHKFQGLHFDCFEAKRRKGNSRSQLGLFLLQITSSYFSSVWLLQKWSISVLCWRVGSCSPLLDSLQARKVCNQHKR